MSDSKLVRLRLEAVGDTEHDNLHMITLISDSKERQVIFFTDKYICDQLSIRFVAPNSSLSRKFLPEVLLKMLKDKSMSLKDDYRIVITAVVDGEYQVVIEDLASSAAYPIRISDAVLLSYISEMPLYMRSKLYMRQGVFVLSNTKHNKAVPVNVIPVEFLEKALQQMIDEENYRMAKILSDELKRRKKQE